MIKAAVIGAGTYGMNVIGAFYAKHLLGEIELVAVADVNPDALARVKEKFGIRGYADYERMLDEERPDAVAVVTPDHMHMQVTLAAARRGIHLMVQKPLATDTQEGLDMVKAAGDSGVMLYVDFHKRFDPGHMHLRQAIRRGSLGKVEYGYVCMEDKILVPTQWFKGWAHKSSPAWFLGVHFYDLIYWLLGEAPLRAYATGQKNKLLSLGIDSYDAIQARFEFSSGAVINVDSSWIIPNGFPSIVNQQIRLVGTDGVEEVDSQDRGMLACYEGDGLSIVPNPYANYAFGDPVAGEIPAGYTIESMQYFLRLINLIKSGSATLESLKGSYPDGEEALISMRMGVAVHKSLESGGFEIV